MPLSQYYGVGMSYTIPLLLSISIYEKENNMKPELLSQEDYPNTLNTEKFLHLKGFFYIDSECIMTENKIINVLEQYDLIEFRDGGGIVMRDVRFWHALMKNNVLKIVVNDTDSNKVLHRTHCTNDESVPCDWLLVEKNYFNDDLLEFDF